MMFRPGFAVQARELTQLQTILQNQIERFGSHLFEDGSIVLDGQVNENYLRYARIGSLPSGVTTGNLIGVDILYPATNTLARVVHAEPGLSSTVDSYGVLFFEYLNGNPSFTIGSVLSATATNGVAVDITITGSSQTPALGDALVVSVDRGVRYTEGFFAMNEAQKLGAYSLTGTTGSYARVYDNPTCRVGFNVTKSFVSADDDESLNDPAFGFYNYAAPGSDRFKIDLPLAQYNYTPTDTSSTDNFSREGFIEFIRVVDGKPIKKELYPEYAVLEDTFARRTYDESGNYTVTPFELNVSEGSTADTLKLNLDPGKAYVFGYELETQSPTSLEINKAREFKTQSNQRVVNGFGPYLKTALGGSAAPGMTGLDLNNEPIVYFSSSATGGFNEIGSARLRHLGYESPFWNAYVYDLSFTGSYGLTSAKAIYLNGYTAHGEQILSITGGTAALYGERKNMIYPVPVGSAVKSFSSVDYAVHRFFRNIAFDSTGSATIDLANYLDYDTGQVLFPNYTNDAFPSEDFSVLGMTGRGFTGTVSRVSNNVIFVSVTGASSFNGHVLSSLEVGDGSTTYLKRTKTLVNETVTVNGLTAVFLQDPSLTSRQFFYINGLADVIDVGVITGQYSGSTADVSQYLTLDGRQTDELYDWSRLYLNAGVTASNLTGPYQISLTRYSHSSGPRAIGPFTAESYPNYDTIPTHTSKITGKKYQLRDVLDFRPTRGLTAIHGHSPPTGTLVNDDDFTYQHYLPRTDKVVATRNRNFEVINGISDLKGTVPSDDPEKMTLYTVTLNPYTFGPDDTSIRFVENKRYTMRDIGSIEKRLESVEKFATMSILEQEAKRISITDSNGLEVPKVAILVDQFRGHSIADVSDVAYAASIDFNKGELRPSFENRVLSFELDEGTGFNAGITATSDGVVMINPTSTSIQISQPLTTTTSKINPSGIISYLGSLTITPSSDNWYDDSNSPTVRVNAEGENDAWAYKTDPFGTQWSDWETNWFGTPSLSDDLIKMKNSEDNRSIFISSLGVDFGSIRSNSVPEQITRSINDLKVRGDIVPYMKATQIQLSAKFLRPNTLVRVYFDGVDMVTLEYVKNSETGSVASNADLTTDANGQLSGIYIDVPAGRFLTGRKTVRISDSSSVTNTTTAADQVFLAQGCYSSQSEGILSTRLPITRRESVRSEKVVSNIFTRNVQRSEQKRLIGFSDPMSQMFLVDAEAYPSGMYISKVSLYMNAGGETVETMPIMVQIKPSTNGFPHPSKVLPFGESVKYVSDIVEDGATDFIFSTPVYLLPGQEYCVSIITNSVNVSVNTAIIGDPLTGEAGTNPRRATKQPYIRKLFKSQSSGAYTSTEKECINFLLHTPIFPVGTNAALIRSQGTSKYGSGNKLAHEYYMNAATLSPASTLVSVKEKGLNFVGDYYPITPNKNIVLPAERSVDLTTDGATKNSVQLTTTDRFVSPQFDLQRSAALLLENIINDTTILSNGENLPTNDSVAVSNRATARYITKRVILEEGITATNLKVVVSLCNPSVSGNTNTIEVYARLLGSLGDTDFDNLSYSQLTAESTIPTSLTDTDFNDVTFSFPTDKSDFRAFSIKIVMISDDPLYVPKIRNMRVVAT